MTTIGWGETAGILAALAAAASSLQVRALGAGYSVHVINTLRCLVGSLGFSVIWWFGSRELGEWQLAIPYLVVGVLFGLVCGDSLYFSAINRIGPGKATPIAMSYPLPTAVLASLFFGEQLSALQLLGVVTGIAAIWVIASGDRDEEAVPGAGRAHLVGVAMAVVASLFWACGILSVRLVLAIVPLDFANLLRLTLATSIMAMFGVPAFRRMNFRTGRLRFVILIVCLGMTAVANNFLLATSIQRSGAAVASLLSSMAPVFAAPLAWLIFSEVVTVRTFLAITLAMAGILLVVWN